MLGARIAVAALLACSAVPAAAAGTDARVTVIADSVGGALYWDTPARRELGRWLDLRLDVRVCRRLVSAGCWAYNTYPPSALDAIQALGHELGPVVVLDVGYNDLPDEYGAGIDLTMQALLDAGVQRVVWVTLAQSHTGWQDIDGLIRSAAARWPQIRVADWGGAEAGHPWLVDDAHLNERGTLAFARFLRPILVDEVASIGPSWLTPAILTTPGPA